METSNPNSNQNVEPSQQAPGQAPKETLVSEFKKNPVQTTLVAGGTVLSLMAMITSFVTMLKTLFPPKK